jgi:RNA polymerase sigma-70 factor, ECF subfamily
MQRDISPALAAFEAGRAAWPGVALGYERFATRIDELEVTADDLVARGADLFLATACAERDAAALRVFEERFVATIEQPRLQPALLDEVRQKVRMKLLLGDEPSIARYRGRGPLAVWVRVTAARVAVDVAAAAHAAPRQADTHILDLLVSMDQSPELETVKARYRDRFRAALETSLTTLSSRDKALLSLHFVDGLTTEAIGAVYRVHRATATRWLLAIRRRVLQQLEERFALSVGASPSAVRSLVKLFGDDIQFSVKRLLRIKEE